MSYIDQDTGQIFNNDNEIDLTITDVDEPS